VFEHNPLSPSSAGPDHSYRASSPKNHDPVRLASGYPIFPSPSKKSKKSKLKYHVSKTAKTHHAWVADYRQHSTSPFRIVHSSPAQRCDTEIFISARVQNLPKFSNQKTYTSGINYAFSTANFKTEPKLHLFKGRCTRFTDTMSGFLGTAASNLVDANLLLQIITYILIIGGVMFEKKGNFHKHGLMMGTAVLLGTASLLLVMGPSLMSSFGGVMTGIYGLGSPLILIHAIIGFLALAMGWTAALTLRPCGQVMKTRLIGNIRLFMRLMAGLWTLTFILGLVVYSYFYL